MNDAEKQNSEEKLKCLTTKLERFLSRACEAEDKRDYLRSGRYFVLALYCEAKLQADQANIYEYVRSAMPVYSTFKSC